MQRQINSAAGWLGVSLVATSDLNEWLSRPLSHPACQVRTAIAAAQEAELARVRADIQRFDAAVSQYVSSIYARRGFFAWATGVEAASAAPLAGHARARQKNASLCAGAV